MAKRELIDRKALIDNGLSKGFCEWYDEIKQAEVINEQEIVKPYLEKLKVEISKSKTEHEMQIAARDTKAKMLISHIYCGIVNILDKCMNDKCDRGCDFCEHTSECMPSKD